MGKQILAQHQVAPDEAATSRFSLVLPSLNLQGGVWH